MKPSVFVFNYATRLAARTSEEKLVPVFLSEARAVKFRAKNIRGRAVEMHVNIGITDKPVGYGLRPATQPPEPASMRIETVHTAQRRGKRHRWIATTLDIDFNPPSTLRFYEASSAEARTDCRRNNYELHMLY